jgi:hypothetical protein
MAGKADIGNKKTVAQEGAFTSVHQWQNGWQAHWESSSTREPRTAAEPQVLQDAGLPGDTYTGEMWTGGQAVGDDFEGFLLDDTVYASLQDTSVLSMSNTKLRAIKKICRTVS